MRHSLPFIARMALCVSFATLPACMSSYQGSAGLDEVDGLVTRVQGVHIESELAREQVGVTVTAMLEVVAPKESKVQDGEGVMTAFETFEAAIEGSKRQERALKLAVSRLEGSAEEFFSGWNDDLEAFKSQQMRIQSRNRMEETRTRYDHIMLASEAPLAQLEEFNVGLEDVVLFLSRDFNSSSVKMIEGDLRQLIRTAGTIQRELDECLEKAQTYVEHAGLPVTVTVDETVDPSQE